MERSKILSYYSRQEIIQALLDAAANREVATALPDGTYGKRPNVLLYKNDIAQVVKEGFVEFHGSVEHWSQAMDLAVGNYDSLRTGWDLLIDIDGKKFDYARIAAQLVVETLEQHGIKNMGIKFSGRRGFHIAVPWSAFPKKINFEETRLMYPLLHRAIAEYIREQIRQELLQKLIEHEGGVGALASNLEKPKEKLDPFNFVEVERNWGVRHMFRLPYSLHKSTWFVSLPLQRSEIKKFQPENANPEKVKVGTKFFPTAEEGEVELLIIEALDKLARTQRKGNEAKKKIIRATSKLPESTFPPSIKKICNSSFADGRKRSLFVLMTFLSSAGWAWEEIDEFVTKWNSKNQPPLPAAYLRSQIRWFSHQNRKILPPNYESGIYKDLGIQEAENEARVAKNPIVIAVRNRRDMA